MSELLDGRREDALRAELLRRASAVFADHADAIEPGKVLHALFAVAARLGEEVTRRLDQVPDKQAANFYDAMGLGRDGPVPAKLPVAIALAQTAPDSIAAPAGTRLQAAVEGVPVTFETTAGISLAKGKIASLCAADLTQDRILVAPGPALAPVLPRAETIARRLASGAGAGAAALQVEPSVGLAEGMVLRIGAAGPQSDHAVAGLDGDLVTIDPPLAETEDDGASVSEVTLFSPWDDGARDHQAHRLYIGHPALLDVASETTISVWGVAQDTGIIWHWYGKAGDVDEADWQAFGAPDFVEDHWELPKPAGKPEVTAIEGRDGLWLRATLTGGSSGIREGRKIRLAVSGQGDAGADCSADASPGIDFEAVAVTTPVVIRKPFHPFGREPRLYDSFHVGCKEAFGKAGAHARLCFTLGGATLGPMAAVADDTTQQVFAVGTDGLLYRAVLGTGQGLERMPLPPALADVGFEKQAAVAARMDGGRIRLAVAGRGCAYHVGFDALAVLGEGQVAWQTLPPDAGRADTPVTAVDIAGDAGGTVTALCGDRMLSWNAAGTDVRLTVTEHAIDLIRVQGIDGALSVFATDEAGDTWEISARIGNAAPVSVAAIPAGSLPAALRVAWASEAGAAAGTFVIAGYDLPSASDAAAPRPLRLGRLSGGDFTPAPVDPGAFVALPILMEPPYETTDRWPVIVIAGPRPHRLVVRGDAVLDVGGSVRIGAGANLARHFLQAGHWTVVQAPDQGLDYREVPGRDPLHSLGSAVLEGRYRLVVQPGVLPEDAGFMRLTGGTEGISAPGDGFELAAIPGDRCLIRPIGNSADVPQNADPAWHVDIALFSPATDAQPAALQVTPANTIVLSDEPDDADTSILVAVSSMLVTGGITRTLWELTRPDATSQWAVPTGFPSTAVRHLYVPLEQLADDNGDPLELRLDVSNTRQGLEAQSDEVTALTRNAPAVPLFDASVSIAATDVAALGGDLAFMPVPLRLIERAVGGSDSVRFAMPEGQWITLGPDRPANPDLSWEYWNGSSWWTLDAHGLADDTADLQINGGVTFTVPPDLAETDVGGRRNHWIRARLIGGDYGQARTTVKSETSADGASVTQSVTRDLGAIRAPYVISLRLGYRVPDPVAPRRVLATDNLTTIDLTSANDADLPVRYFVPVSALFAPALSLAAGTTGTIDACCDDRGDEVAVPPVQRVGAALERAILIGFDRRPQGDGLSLFIDAEPTGSETELAAFAFRGGAFQEIAVVRDATAGLNEAGIVVLDVAQPLDVAGMLGTSAYWLALGPKRDAERWAPRLRGIHLNGVIALSVETRRNESLGSSTGAPDQRLRLVAAPVDPDSLDVWIAEPVGAEEAQALGAEAQIEGMPGPWLRWSRRDEFPAATDTAAPGRFYTLNALTGEITFGNGANALIPPAHSPVLARSYRQVTGQAANGIAAGTALQVVSALPGVDKVLALDGAAGGVDAETLEAALARAPAKLRSDDRLTTLADIEEYVRARMGWAAQARAVSRRGKVRLVVAGRGAGLLPQPSALREVAANVGRAATYGIGAPGRLEVVAPRLLPVTVSVTLRLDSGADRIGIMTEARAAIAALFDHETGGHDGRGWPIGAVPLADDIAAALADVAQRAVLGGVTIRRRDGGQPLPDAAPFPAVLPPDVLVRVAPADIAIDAQEEVEA